MPSLVSSRVGRSVLVVQDLVCSSENAVDFRDASSREGRAVGHQPQLRDPKSTGALHVLFTSFPYSQAMPLLLVYGSR